MSLITVVTVFSAQVRAEGGAAQHIPDGSSRGRRGTGNGDLIVATHDESTEQGAAHPHRSWSGRLKKRVCTLAGHNNISEGEQQGGSGPVPVDGGS